MTQRNVLITGATDGIGLAVARFYLASGARVIVIGRRSTPDLESALWDNYCRADLVQPFTAALVADFLSRRSITRLDLLIHCAGIGSYGSVEAQAPEVVDALLDTNLRAPIALTHRLIPLLAAARGRVVFIGSVAAALPVPDYAVYGATKAALEGFARSLRVELRGQVDVQVIHPGATRTAMHAKVGAPLEHIGWRRFPRPERVACKIVRAIERGTHVVTIGTGNQLLRFAGRHLGSAMDSVICGREGQQDTASPQPTARPQELTSARHCIITGGADGIGRAVAERYAQAGFAVTIIDRDVELADEVCSRIRAMGGTAVFIGADLSQPDDIAEVLRCLAKLPTANIFVHSAGINAVGTFGESAIARQYPVLDVNLRAPLQLTAGLLREMRLAKGATLVFIASLSVFTSYPGAATYAASKDGLTAYARSLRIALARQQINVLTVFPGPTRTAHARRYSPDNRRESRRMLPAYVAQYIAAAVDRRDATLVPGLSNRLVAVLGRLAPTLIEYLMRRTILNKLPRTGTLPSQAVRERS